MIQLKRLKTGTNINTVQLEVGQPLVDPNKSLLYIGTDSDKLKFYDSNHVDTKVVNTVQVGSSEIKPTSGKLKFEAGTNVTLEANTTTKTITISSSYRNTAHTHSKGEGLSVTGSGGVDGEVSYSLNAATQASLGGIKLGFNAQSGMLPIKLGEGDDDKKAYASLPTASTSSLGGVKSHETGTEPDRDYYVEVKSDSTMKVNVPWSNTAHNHLNGEGLSVSGSGGIDGNVTYSLNAAQTDKLGGIKVKEVLTTEQLVEKVSNNHKYYGIDIDKNGKAFVDVPMYQLPAAKAFVRGGVRYDNNYGVYVGNTSDGFCVSYLCNERVIDGNHAVVVKTTSLIPKVSNDSDYSGQYSLYPAAEHTDLGSSLYPYGKIFVQDVCLLGKWNAASMTAAGLTSLKDKLESIDERLDSLGFNEGSDVTIQGIGSSDFTIKVYKLGKAVWCNQNISPTMYVYNKRKSTTNLPSNLRPSSSTSGAILGYNINGSYQASYATKITIDTDGFITLEINNNMSVGATTGNFMNYICFAYKLD